MEDNLLNILLVEDDMVDVMNVQRAFKKNNITNPLYVAHNGLEALNMLKGENGVEKLTPTPKIVLLDINMPKMNGIELLRAMRADKNLKSISVFMMTTSNEDSDKIEAYSLNVAGYILKPINFEKFVTAVSTLNNFWKMIELP
ncbi:MAG: response regulator [Bacteroidetes bacterium]|jgi:CheY-like chemotaxis protein|nr:response regulator [Bacteroidota bacterium]MBT5529688.1 response regulator [Cytophagia bacterium]MBT3422181.1 response regulator [Bacteroidota bacterium]MBT3801773.1 response regulator [Bacteroidota bacterium]MBT4339803.1 response regulator [Bacteroidota bacterium]